MQIKKELSKSIVFVSVFAGTLISEGILLVTIADPGKKLAEKVNHTIKSIKSDIHERFYIASARIIEERALVNSKINGSECVRLFQIAKNSFVDSFEKAKDKYSKGA